MKPAKIRRTFTTLDGSATVEIDCRAPVEGGEAYDRCEKCDACGCITAASEMRFNETTENLLCGACTKGRR